MESPPPLAEAAVIGPTSELVQRVEIYESDGTTRWQGGVNDNRLIDGSVNVDYSRDERRSFDIRLDNTDFGLEHTPEQFWYDKILKIFWGVKYVDTSPLITQKIRTNLALNPRAVAASGYSPNNTYWTVALNQAVTGHPYGIVTAAKSTVATAGSAGTTIASFYNLDSMGATATSRYWGTWVFCSVATTVTVYSNGNQSATSITYPVSANTWTFVKTVVAGTGHAILTANKGSATVNGDTFYVTGTIAETVSLGQFFDGATQDFANRDYAWSGGANASSSTETITIETKNFVDAIWEVQVGEFLIDSINEDHFPYVVSVNGRDYTKKCMLSKFATATAFASGTAIETAIKAMAQNAGIVKFLMPPTGRSLGKDYVYERGVSRWEAMKDIASAFGYELFFDAQGYLVMREYLDPVTAPIAYTLGTGPIDGNLVSYSKSLNDSRIYNKIVVTGESSEAGIPPVSAVATNTNPDSPTRIAKLGERVYQYTSSFITTTPQAQDVADKFLQIHALEEFDLNFSSIALPWLEVGEIVEFIDPRPSDGQPTRFLLSSLNIPLGLEAMSGNAKRVSVVG